MGIIKKWYEKKREVKRIEQEKKQKEMEEAFVKAFTDNVLISFLKRVNEEQRYYFNSSLIMHSIDSMIYNNDIFKDLFSNEDVEYYDELEVNIKDLYLCKCKKYMEEGIRGEKIFTEGYTIGIIPLYASEEFIYAHEIGEEFLNAQGTKLVSVIDGLPITPRPTFMFGVSEKKYNYMYYIPNGDEICEPVSLIDYCNKKGYLPEYFDGEKLKVEEFKDILLKLKKQSDLEFISADVFYSKTEKKEETDNQCDFNNRGAINTTLYGFKFDEKNGNGGSGPIATNGNPRTHFLSKN